MVGLRKEKRLQVRPDFEKRLSKRTLDIEVEKNPEWKDYVVANKYIAFHNRNLNIAKSNIGTFYSHLYQSIFGGHIIRKFKTEKEVHTNGDETEERNFHPDHIRFENHRKIFCEIKAISDKNSKPWCSSGQLENYCNDQLVDAFETMFTPELEYAFFRYKHRNDNEKKTSVLTTQELARRLSRQTKDLLIVPSNLLFLMLLASENNYINQESNKGPNEAHYWKIYGKLITRMHNQENPTQLVKEYKGDRRLRNELCLDNIDVESTGIPEGLHYGIMPIKPLTITRYFNRDPKEWSEHFKQHHEGILTKTLGVRDLYQEAKEVPF